MVAVDADVLEDTLTVEHDGALVAGGNGVETGPQGCNLSREQGDPSILPAAGWCRRRSSWRWRRLDAGGV